MYESFYGLTAKPFLTVPDPDFLFWSSGHQLAVTMLRYGVMTNAPITVITGEIGAGKTTLVRQLMGEMPPDIVVALISNMQSERGELLHWVMMALGEPFEDVPYVRLFGRFQDYLIARYAEGRRVILIFDEAQNLSISSLEELRLLSNINADKDQLIQLILVGQPQLRELLDRPELRQFAQRISSDFNLGPLSEPEVEGYITRRLTHVGASWTVFPTHTCGLIFEATGGVPRLINILCDLCMVYGFSSDRKVITEDLLREFLTASERHGIYRQFKSIGASPRAKLVQQS